MPERSSDTMWRDAPCGRCLDLFPSGVCCTPRAPAPHHRIRGLTALLRTRDRRDAVRWAATTVQCYTITTLIRNTIEALNPCSMRTPYPAWMPLSGSNRLRAPFRGPFRQRSPCSRSRLSSLPVLQAPGGCWRRCDPQPANDDKCCASIHWTGYGALSRSIWRGSGQTSSLSQDT